MSLQQNLLSDIHASYKLNGRPVSFSDSYMLNEINIERASHFNQPVSKKQSNQSETEIIIFDNVLRFSFHITLISVFETMFFLDMFLHWKIMG